MVLLGLVAGLVRVRTNRCGIKPEWAALIAVGTAAACLASALLADGPLLEELMVCTARRRPAAESSKSRNKSGD